MSWISPSTCSSSGLMGTSLAMAGRIPPPPPPSSPLPGVQWVAAVAVPLSCPLGFVTPPFRWRQLVSAWLALIRGD
jgi:hypothetical protein